MQQQATQKLIKESPERDPTSPLDLRTHIRNADTGGLMRIQHYTLRCREGVRYFEVPKGSGNLFYESSEPAGRWENKKINAEAEHIAYSAPKTPQDLLEAERDKNAALEAELTAMRAERTGKTGAAQGTTSGAKAQVQKN